MDFFFICHMYAAFGTANIHTDVLLWLPRLPFLQFGGEEYLYSLMRIAFNLSPCDEAGVSVARSLHSAFCIW